MKKEWADKWVDALRNGPYTQTRRMLRGSEGFCCLGVLCDLVKDEPLVQGRWREGFVTAISFEVSHTLQSAVLPQRVQKLVGMSSENGLLKNSEGSSTTLSTLNDDGKTFDEIARIIEKHWQDL
jgi:hypothetical protein